MMRIRFGSAIAESMSAHCLASFGSVMRLSLYWCENDGIRGRSCSRLRSNAPDRRAELLSPPGDTDHPRGLFNNHIYTGATTWQDHKHILFSNDTTTNGRQLRQKIRTRLDSNSAQRVC